MQFNVNVINFIEFAKKEGCLVKRFYCIHAIFKSAESTHFDLLLRILQTVVA